MKRLIYLGTLLIAWSLHPTAAQAQPPSVLFDGCKWSFPSLCEMWGQRKCWCPDDYRAKTMPCVPPNPRGCVDDYCAKKLPCVPANPRGCVDDYCPRQCPLILRGNVEPWYTCGTPEACLKTGGTGLTHQ